MSDAALHVYWNQDLVGKLRLDSSFKLSFQYDPAWLSSKNVIPISLSLPLQSEPFPDERTRPFFSNLLPEGSVRTAVARALGISEKNDFSLLEALGGECAGAVSLQVKKLKEPARKEEDHQSLSFEELDQMIESLPRRPILIGKEGFRLSLAGAQSKLPLCFNGKTFSLPKEPASSSHILKPPSERWEGIVFNEAFCMNLASKLGIKTPASRIFQTPKNYIYLVHRYDRHRTKTGIIKRLHQEDFCQSLGYLPEFKYESEGGPNLQKCFELLKLHSSNPREDRKALVQWCVFNYLIGNMDAHAKNLSILINQNGSVSLSPFYDLLSTLAYPELSNRFAMKIGKENRENWIYKRHWERMADSIGFKSNSVLDTCHEFAERCPNLALELRKDFTAKKWDHPILDKIIQLIGKRANVLLERIR